MKKIILIVSLVLICGIAEAKVYVAIDKSTGDAKGMVDVDPIDIAGWAKNYTMIEADENYRGLQGNEIKVEDSKLRKATKEEIDTYKAGEVNKTKTAEKSKALSVLGLTESDLTNIKALK